MSRCVLTLFPGFVLLAHAGRRRGLARAVLLSLLGYTVFLVLFPLVVGTPRRDLFALFV
jgi:hypothetical protein